MRDRKDEGRNGRTVETKVEGRAKYERNERKERRDKLKKKKAEGKANCEEVEKCKGSKVEYKAEK